MQAHNSSSPKKAAVSSRDPRKEPYLERRGAIFWFVRVVPKDIREKLGFDRWRVSLRTDSYSTAREKCRAEAVRTDAIIREERMPSPFEEAERRLALLSTEEQRRIAGAGGLREFMKAIGYTHMLMSLSGIAAAMSPKPESDGAPGESAVLEAERQALIAQTRSLHAAVAENAEILRSLGLQANGEASELPPEPKKKHLAPPTSREKTAEDKENPWLEEYMATVVEAKSVGPEHESQLSVSVRRFVEVNGPLRLKAITRRHVEAFRDAMMALPYRSELLKHGSGDLRVPAAVAFGKEHGLKVLTRSTAQSQVNHINALFNFAIKEGKLIANPCFGVRVYKEKVPFSVQAEEDRVGFTVDELTMINEKIEKTWGERSDRFDDLWLYRILLYTGARPEEIAQTEVSDVSEVDGVWVIQVRDGAGEDGFELKIKNKYSLRQIPVHPELIKMGFLEFVRSVHGPRLFASFSQNRYRMAGATSRRFHYILRTNLGIIDKRKVFYSLRHTFTTAMRNAGIVTYLQMQIQGHGHDDKDAKARGDGRGSAIHDGYGKTVTLKVLETAIARVDPFMVPVTAEDIAAVAFVSA